MQYGADRKRWLAFCSGVAHAEHVAEALRARGIAAGCVTGKTKAAKRDQIIAQFRSGQLRALTNADVLTTGFDAPETDLLIMLRPTQSPGLYVQIAGRGMRIAQGKENCLVLDFAGNAMRHGPVDQVEAWIPRPKDGPSESPSKTCPECQTISATAVRVCPACGYEFPWDESPRHDAHASTAPMMSTEASEQIEIHKVTRCAYHHHQSAGKLPTLRVDYYNGFVRVASEWVCLEHSGFPRAKAAAWWARRAPGSPAPASVSAALEADLGSLLRRPSAITLNTRPKYPEIIGYEFDQPDRESLHAGNAQ
jgi:DNA repair protein RadD